MEKIKEVVYFTGTYPELDLLRINYFKGSNLLWLAYPYTWIIYLDTDNKEIVRVRHFSSTDNFPRSFSFRYHLQNMPQKNRDCVLHLLTLYQNLFVNEEKIFAKLESKNEVFNALTKNTFGRLLYKEQAAEVFSNLTGCGMDEARKWTIGLTQLTKGAVSKAFAFELESDYSLFDLWSEHTIMGTLYIPKYEMADKILSLIK